MTRQKETSQKGLAGAIPCIPLPAGGPQANASKRSLGLYKKPRPIGARLFARACKPGSVVDGHLSGTRVAARLKPPPSGRPGRPCVPFHGVAPDRVYSAVMSPCGGRALISAFPPLRRRKVRSPPFPAKASGFRRKLRSLPCSSFPHESAGLSWGPHLISLLAEDRRGISLLHLSEGFPWRALPVILALWSPDFPHARAFAVYARPPGPLPSILPLLAAQSQ